MKSTEQRIKGGFTLIELLVVIAIIAILAAILFPVFAKVREKARQTSCLSNEKQLGLGLMQYTEDYDETYPCGINVGQVGVPVGWAGQIYPYVKSVQVFTCPDDTNPLDVVSYAINAYTGVYSQYTGAGSAQSGRSDAGFAAPATTVLLVECYNSYLTPGTLGWYGWDSQDLVDGSDLSSPATNGDSVWGWSSNEGRTWSGVDLATGLMSGQGTANEDNGTYSGPIVAARHTGGSNYLLADGHAKWLHGSSVSPGWGNVPSSYITSNGGCSSVTWATLPSDMLNNPSCGNVSVTFNPEF